MNPETNRRTFAKLILVKDSVTELRVIGGPKGLVYCGWFDTTEQLAEAFGKADDLHASGVYITLNPVDRALLARRANRFAPASRGESTTGDRDITARRWLLVDLDVDRPSGISSTDEEHQAALQRARDIKTALNGDGWPDPIMADSGNGAHLLYKIDLPNNDDARDLVRHALMALDLRFGDARVKIDTSVFNAARIAKAPGTTARKGDDVADRPHRMAELLSIPDEIYPVTEAQLQALAAMVPEEPKADKRSGHGRIDLLGFLQAAGIGHDEGRSWNSQLLWRLYECPFSDAHDDGAYAIQFSSGAVLIRCHHASCQGKGWADLRKQFPDAAQAAIQGGSPTGRTKKVQRPRPADSDASEGPHTPRPTASQVLAEGSDPFSDEAIIRVFDREAVGFRANLNDKKPVPDLTDVALARAVIAYFSGIYTHGRFYAFVRHAYETLGDAQLEKFIAQVIELSVSPIRATARRVEAVRKLVAVLAHKPDEWANQVFDAKELVVFQNGVLELPSLAFRSGQPDDLMTMQLHCNWEPEASQGSIDDFLGLLLREDEVLPFLQFVGYAMVPGAPSQEKYAILLGAGENGKSRLLLVLAELFKGFTASIPFQDLAKNRFEKANLYGKMVNLVGDMSAELVEDTSVIKTLCGGDVIHADIKFKKPIEFINRAKAVISSNELFRANDHTWGFYRRAMIFHFERDFREGGADGDKRDPAVVDKLLADPGTLPRLAYLGVQAYLRLRQEGRFAESSTMVASREDFRLANDSVAAFIAEVLMEQRDHDLPKEDLYRAFALWTKATGRGTVGEAKFWQRWGNAKPPYAQMVRARVEGVRVYVVRHAAIDPACQVVVGGHEGHAISLNDALSREAAKRSKDRATICYRCHASLTSDDNPTCSSCGWLICSECNACAPTCSTGELGG